MDAIQYFDGKAFSYTYDNAWSFTSVFRGDLRISYVEGRGELRETVTVQRVQEERFLITWVDDEMGPITQFVDFKANTLWAAVRWEGEMQIWRATITAFEDA